MRRVAGLLAIWASWLLIPGLSALAQQPNVHYYHQGVLPPGAIGSQQLQRGGPLPGYYQPVEIKAPNGAMISLAPSGQFEEPRKALRKAGLLIGSVYRLRVTGIPLAEGQEVFPTVEVIDRLFTPLGQEHRFSIPIELSDEDLKLALAGKFVTRIIYLEDPRDALPVRDDPQRQTWFEVAPSQDPLAVADSLGRPVAILRLGGRIPDANTGPDPQFFFGCPPFVDYPNLPAVAEEPPTAPTVKKFPKSAVKTAAKPKAKPVDMSSLPRSSAASPRSRVAAQFPDATASKEPLTNAEYRTSDQKKKAAPTAAKTTKLDNQTLKASFKFEPQPTPKSDVKILPPPPTLE